MKYSIFTVCAVLSIKAAVVLSQEAEKVKLARKVDDLTKMVAVPNYNGKSMEDDVSIDEAEVAGKNLSVSGSQEVSGSPPTKRTCWDNVNKQVVPCVPEQCWDPLGEMWDHCASEEEEKKLSVARHVPSLRGAVQV